MDGIVFGYFHVELGNRPCLFFKLFTFTSIKFGLPKYLFGIFLALFQHAKCFRVGDMRLPRPVPL
jgi:hypothetical protein